MNLKLLIGLSIFTIWLMVMVWALFRVYNIKDGEIDTIDRVVGVGIISMLHCGVVMAILCRIYL